MLGASIEATGAEVSGSSADAGFSARQRVCDATRWDPDRPPLERGSGFGLLKALQEHSLAPDAVKVALTNYAREDCEELCCRLGADRFFDKTFEAKKCMGLIKSLVEEKRHGLSGRAALEEVGAPGKKDRMEAGLPIAARSPPDPVQRATAPGTS